MELISLLLATLFVAPPVPPEPDVEPGMAPGNYVDVDPLPFGAVARYGTLRYRGGFAGKVAFSRDGKSVLSAGADNNLHFWETDTGQLVRRYKAFSSYNHTFARSPDGEQVITGNCNEKELVLREIETGKVIRRLAGMKDFPGTLRFSPDGKFVAACETNAGSAVIWDKATGKELARLQMGRFGRAGQQAASTLAFSQDGKYIAVAGLEVMIFEVEGWKHVATLVGHSDHIYSIAFTPDNTRIVTGAVDRTLRVWDLATQKEIRRITNDISGWVATTRDGKTAIGNDKQGRLTAWNLETGKPSYLSSAKIPANGFTLSDDETRIASWTFSAVVVFDARTGRCLTPMPVPAHPPGMIAFSPNGKFLALTYGRPGPPDVRLWSFQSGQVSRQPKVTLELPSALRVSDGREVFLFGSSPETGFELWNLKTKKKTVLPKGDYSPVAVFAKNGSLYAGGRELIEWDTAANRIERRIPVTGGIWQLLLSADERVLMGGRYAAVTSWSTVTGKQLASLTFPRHDHLLALSADGKHFVTGGERSACLRNTSDGTIALDLAAKDSVAAAFSPDGRLIVLADGPGAFQLWDMKTRKKLRRINGHREMLVKLLFSADSRYLASVSNDTTILVWDVRKIAPGGK